MPPKNAGDPEEITGQSALPISRIKKIVQLDEDIVQCSNNATFVIAMATEMFIHYLAEQGHNVVKSERKPRKTVQYRDLATAVSHIDNLEFLADVIPKTTTYKQFKEKKAKEAAGNNGGGVMEKGQRTLNGTGAPANQVNGNSAEDPMAVVMAAADEEPRPAPATPRAPVVTHTSGSVSALVVDRTVEPIPAPGSYGTMGHDPDVEMKD
ncbi:Histone-fold [Penicillium lagena]|uniref:Histone-fold n=1 Tax=Penicillium lagena TaxID=94218 RepID=UPI00254012EF|nr:Histone-fold [Penicillium lagena]KAJ5619914.1 Histone-fold [Penicillium lagena]